MEQTFLDRLNVAVESTLFVCPIIGFVLALAGLRADRPDYADVGFWLAGVAYAIYALRIILEGLGDSSGSARDVAILWRVAAVLAVGVVPAIAIRVVFADRGEPPEPAFYVCTAVNVVIQAILVVTAAILANPLRRKAPAATAQEGADRQD